MSRKLKNHAVMRLYELVINDFRVRKVNFGDHFTSLSGSRCQYWQFFQAWNAYTHNIARYSAIFKKIAGVYFIQFVRNTGGAFIIRGEAFIRGNTVIMIHTLCWTQAFLIEVNAI